MRPKIFLLENVEGLWKLHREALCLILKVLDSMVDSCGQILHLAGWCVWHCLVSQYEKFHVFLRYDISWNMLNAKEVAGIPQNRVRLFIAGTLRVAKKRNMEWPEEAAPLVSSSHLILSLLIIKIQSCFIEPQPSPSVPLITEVFLAAKQTKSNKAARTHLQHSAPLPPGPYEAFEALPGARNLQQAKEDFKNGSIKKQQLPGSIVR